MSPRITSSIALILLTLLLSMPLTILNLLSINNSHVAIAQQIPMITNQSLIGAMSTAILGSSTNKTFYVFTSSHEDVNQTKLGIPPDSFSPSVIAVNKGDTVNIIFYNLETPPNGDRHSFTLGEPYNIDKDLGPGQRGVITFKATEDGTYQFFCKYHQPTMRGELIVLP